VADLDDMAADATLTDLRRRLREAEARNDGPRDREHTVQLGPGATVRLIQWLNTVRSGSWRGGTSAQARRVTVEAVEGGGILVRTQPYRAGDGEPSSDEVARLTEERNQAAGQREAYKAMADAHRTRADRLAEERDDLSERLDRALADYEAARDKLVTVAGERDAAAEEVTKLRDKLDLTRKGRDEYRNVLEAINGWLVRDGHIPHRVGVLSVTGPVHELLAEVKKLRQQVIDRDNVIRTGERALQDAIAAGNRKVTDRESMIHNLTGAWNVIEAAKAWRAVFKERGPITEKAKLLVAAVDALGGQAAPPQASDEGACPTCGRTTTVDSCWDPWHQTAAPEVYVRAGAAVTALLQAALAWRQKIPADSPIASWADTEDIALIEAADEVLQLQVTVDDVNRA
jgi:hypothetical protein